VIVQDDAFDATESITICAFSTDPTEVLQQVIDRGPISAMPVAASPAPRKSSVWSASLPPVVRNADMMPASATAAVHWMSSLKTQNWTRYLRSSRKALWLAKSSN
jgi:hypothetical protein